MCPRWIRGSEAREWGSADTEGRGPRTGGKNSQKSLPILYKQILQNRCRFSLICTPFRYLGWSRSGGDIQNATITLAIYNTSWSFISLRTFVLNSDLTIDYCASVIAEHMCWNVTCLCEHTCKCPRWSGIQRDEAREQVAQTMARDLYQYLYQYWYVQYQYSYWYQYWIFILVFMSLAIDIVETNQCT